MDFYLIEFIRNEVKNNVYYIHKGLTNLLYLTGLINASILIASKSPSVRIGIWLFVTFPEL